MAFLGVVLMVLLAVCFTGMSVYSIIRFIRWLIIWLKKTKQH